AARGQVSRVALKIGRPVRAADEIGERHAELAAGVRLGLDDPAPGGAAVTGSLEDDQDGLAAVVVPGLVVPVLELAPGGDLPVRADRGRGHAEAGDPVVVLPGQDRGAV